MKRIYVNTKMLFYRLLIAPFAHERIRHMVKYFSRYLITTAKRAVKIEPIKYLEKYMPACLSCAKEAIYMWQNSIFYILHKYVTKF